MRRHQNTPNIVLALFGCVNTRDFTIERMAEVSVQSNRCYRRTNIKISLNFRFRNLRSARVCLMISLMSRNMTRIRAANVLKQWRPYSHCQFSLIYCQRERIYDRISIGEINIRLPPSVQLKRTTYENTSVKANEKNWNKRVAHNFCVQQVSHPFFFSSFLLFFVAEHKLFNLFCCLEFWIGSKRRELSFMHCCVDSFALVQCVTVKWMKNMIWCFSYNFTLHLLLLLLF